MLATDRQYQIEAAQTLAAHARHALPDSEAGEIAFELLSSLGDKWRYRARFNAARVAIVNAYANATQDSAQDAYATAQREVAEMRTP